MPVVAKPQVPDLLPIMEKGRQKLTSEKRLFTSKEDLLRMYKMYNIEKKERKSFVETASLELKSSNMKHKQSCLHVHVQCSWVRNTHKHHEVTQTIK